MTDAPELEQTDEEFLALVRRARAVAAVAREDVERREQLELAERRWIQATTRDGKRYYYDRERRATVQWERPMELKGSRAGPTLRAEARERATLPESWRELKSDRRDGVPYYWNVETGETRWERPRNDALVVARVIS